MQPHHLPAEFVTWLRGYIASAQYTSAVRLHRGLILRWLLWQEGNETNALPGYATPPPATATGFPAGWTVRNLRDIARETLAEPARTGHRAPDLTRYAHA
jgi:hypothetical protein